MNDSAPIWRNGITNTIIIVDYSLKHFPKKLDIMLDNWFKISRKSSPQTYEEAETIFKKFFETIKTS